MVQLEGNFVLLEDVPPAEQHLFYMRMILAMDTCRKFIQLMGCEFQLTAKLFSQAFELWEQSYGWKSHPGRSPTNTIISSRSAQRSTCAGDSRPRACGSSSTTTLCAIIGCRDKQKSVPLPIMWAYLAAERGIGVNWGEILRSSFFRIVETLQHAIKMGKSASTILYPYLQRLRPQFDLDPDQSWKFPGGVPPKDWRASEKMRRLLNNASDRSDCIQLITGETADELHSTKGYGGHEVYLQVPTPCDGKFRRTMVRRCPRSCRGVPQQQQQQQKQQQQPPIQQPQHQQEGVQASTICPPLIAILERPQCDPILITMNFHELADLPLQLQCEIKNSRMTMSLAPTWCEQGGFGSRGFDPASALLNNIFHKFSDRKRSPSSVAAVAAQELGHVSKNHPAPAGRREQHRADGKVDDPDSTEELEDHFAADGL
ncbi:hypothetical protein SELMODRAFT_426732 [Selaginella moellendorffii]|uniref:Uncharacterized protein n=1 Tax=Selaginella moellendorffii TaxID=88036 RepID=D8SXB0_SELML|nr:hypothetical protein SELMODRAFT_426732 [Selaginella moellendorffii]